MASYVTLEEAKSQCRVDFDDDNYLIHDLVDVAEARILEEVKGQFKGTGKVTTNGTTTLTGNSDTIFVDEVTAGDVIVVEGETRRTVSSVTDKDTVVVSVAFTTSNSGLSYYIEKTPLVSSALPKPLKQAILLLVGELYEHREASIINAGVMKLPYAIEYLIAPYKYWVLK